MKSQRTGGRGVEVSGEGKIINMRVRIHELVCSFGMHMLPWVYCSSDPETTISYTIVVSSESNEDRYLLESPVQITAPVMPLSHSVTQDYSILLSSILCVHPSSRLIFDTFIDMVWPMLQGRILFCAPFWLILNTSDLQSHSYIARKIISYHAKKQTCQELSNRSNVLKYGSHGLWPTSVSYFPWGSFHTHPNSDYCVTIFILMQDKPSIYR